MAQLTPSDLEPTQIRQAAADVLSGYEQAQPGLVSRALRWLLDQLAEVIADVIAVGGNGLGVVLLGAVVGGVALLAWRLVRRVRRDRAGPPTAGTISGRTAQDWRADAQRHEAQHAWAPALRSHYRALLADLVAAGMIHETAGRTARGYLRDVVDVAPDAATAMTAVTAAFEAAWYDRRDVTEADVRALRDAAETVRRRTLVPA